MNTRSEGSWPYVIAVLSVAVFTALRFALDWLLGTRAELAPFVCAVVLAALFGGLRGGITAILLSVPTCDYLFVEPRYTFFIYDPPGDTAALVLFAVLATTVAVIIDRFHRTRVRLRAANLKLQQSELRFKTLAATIPEIVFTAKPDGTRDYFSQGYCDYTGLASEGASTEWKNLIHPDDRQSVLDQWAKSIETGQEFSAMYRVRRADGEYRWFKGHAKPVREPSGEILQWTGVAADIHDQESLAEALAVRTDQLVASNEEFQKFAYRITHDLKEPLRMIGVFTEFLVKRNQNHLDGESRTFTGYILSGVSRIERQIRDLLDYTKAGSLEVRRQEADFEEILNSAIDNLRSTIIETDASITYDPLPRLVVNQDRMRSVFQNLIGNALKYRSSRPPRIHISARLENDEWVFSVQDNGVGFEMSEAERIFAAFERLSSDAKVEGSGLGLAIVKRIVELKGGRIWAQSAPGVGSTFYFTLPSSVVKKTAVQARAQVAGASSDLRAS